MAAHTLWGARLLPTTAAGHGRLARVRLREKGRAGMRSQTLEPPSPSQGQAGGGEGMRTGPADLRASFSQHSAKAGHRPLPTATASREEGYTSSGNLTHRLPVPTPCSLANGASGFQSLGEVLSRPCCGWQGEGMCPLLRQLRLR